MKTLAIVNTKGGCGKTTTAINLAASLGWQGLSVLLIDIDPQGHATLGVNVKTEDEAGLFDVFLEQKSIHETIIHDVVAGIDLIPSTSNLINAEGYLRTFQYEYILKKHLEQLKGEYAYVIIDCPPSLGPLTSTALMAADELIAPVEMSLFAIDSLERLFTSIHQFEQEYQRAFPIRVLPTMVDNRTRLARAFMRTLWERFADDVLPIMVHNTIRVREAVCKGLPIIDYDAGSPAAFDYNRLADEVILTSTPAHIRDEMNQVDRQQEHVAA
jgi:chromosome partitioning protein